MIRLEAVKKSISGEKTSLCFKQFCNWMPYQRSLALGDYIFDRL